MQPLIWSVLARFSPFCALSDQIDRSAFPVVAPLTHRLTDPPTQRRDLGAHGLRNYLSSFAHQITSRPLPKMCEKTCTWTRINPSAAFSACFSLRVSSSSEVAHHVVNYRQKRVGGLGATGAFR